MLTFDNFSQVQSDAAEQLDDGLVETGSDAGLSEDSLTHMRVANTKSELLFFARFGGRQMGSEESFQSRGHYIGSNGLLVLKSFFGSFEGLVGLNFDHLGEALN